MQKKFTRTVVKNIVLLLGISGVIFFSCQPQQIARLETVQTDSGWGYKIIIEGKAYINQPSIPAISGIKSFQSEQDARKVGRLVLKKIGDGQMPTISLHEIDSLKIVY
ncbi:MAG: DUF4907 domain-containing protein [Mangrovibacterium sp.]